MLLFLYRTTKHATTRLSPHEVLFGSSLQIPTLPSMVIPDPSEYSSSLKKILELRELVEANIVKSAEHQQLSRTEWQVKSSGLDRKFF